jgi:adenylate cyclase class 2
MPQEIEAKLPVADFAAVRASLRELGATHVGSVLETNVFFDTGNRSLTAAHKGLRLRTNHDLSSNDDSYVITFKGPLQPGNVKTREEIELVVESADDARALLHQLGYNEILSFEKRRESWKMDGCKIELDEVPHLGKFVEIEGPHEQQVMQVRERLKLCDCPIIKTSYSEMLVEHLKRQGASQTHIGFGSN